MAASCTPDKKFLQELRRLAALIHAALPELACDFFRYIPRRSLSGVKTDYPDGVFIKAFQQIVGDTFNGVFNRWNPPGGWWGYWSFARGRAESTLHDEHLGCPASFLHRPTGASLSASVQGELLTLQTAQSGPSHGGACAGVISRVSPSSKRTGPRK
jgi:hypothetical protein